MRPSYDDGQARFYLGDVREVLRALPAGSVNMCVTSPPYWSLRDYGIAASVWGERPDDFQCPVNVPHEWGETLTQQRGGAYMGKTKWQHIAGEANEEGVPVRTLNPEAWGLVDGHPVVESGQFCQRCGAWRGCLGLEPSPDLFVEHIVEVFREVRRVLADDGTLWLNIGDSYASGGKGGGGSYMEERRAGSWSHRSAINGWRSAPEGLKSKDVVGIPWMVAFALRADGWWLRQDIIWSKPNPMPESATDRCTKAHEYLFLLSKRERYYYDHEAIREPSEGWKGSRFDDGKNEVVHPDVGRNRGEPTAETRNKRSVWSIPTAPFAEAHFATFPPDLVKPCILAGSREGGTVLDPFLGSGTTAMVAKALGRRSVGIDLSEEYLEMAKRRCGQLSLLMPGGGA